MVYCRRAEFKIYTLNIFNPAGGILHAIIFIMAVYFAELLYLEIPK